MSSRVKEVAQGKEKRRPSLSTTPKVDSSNGSKAKSVGAGPPGREGSNLIGKSSTPSHLKPTLISKPTLKADPGNKSFKKSPFPSQAPRTPFSSSPKDKLVKTLSTPSTRAKVASSPKPLKGRTPKLPRNGKDHPPVKGKSFRRDNNLDNREVKASPTRATTRVATRNLHKVEKLKGKTIQEIDQEMEKVDESKQHSSVNVQFQPGILDICESSTPGTTGDNSFFLQDSEDESFLTEEKEDSSCCESIEKGDDIKDEECKDGGKFPVESSGDEIIDGEKEIKEVELQFDNEKVKHGAGNERETIENNRWELPNRRVGLVENPVLDAVKTTKPQNIGSRDTDTPVLSHNDVIKQTVSELASNRKSKVMALIGAFENVISLQETPGQGKA